MIAFNFYRNEFPVKYTLPRFLFSVKLLKVDVDGDKFGGVFCFVLFFLAPTSFNNFSGIES